MPFDPDEYLAKAKPAFDPNKYLTKAKPAFNPDEYLAKTEEFRFDPDKYLASTILPLVKTTSPLIKPISETATKLSTFLTKPEIKSQQQIYRTPTSQLKIPLGEIARISPVVKGVSEIATEVATPTPQKGATRSWVPNWEILEKAPKVVSEPLAATLYEVAGAIKGLTLGYTSPEKFLETTPLAKANINKKVAMGAGQLIGSTLPISKISQGVRGLLTVGGVLKGVRPILQLAVQSSITGSIHGIARKPEVETIQKRLSNSLEDAAYFIVFTGAGVLFDKAVRYFRFGKLDLYNSLRQDIINKFKIAGVPEGKAEAMADIGLKQAVKEGGGMSELKMSDIRGARKAIKNGEKIIIGKDRPVEPEPTHTERATRPFETEPVKAIETKPIEKVKPPEFVSIAPKLTKPTEPTRELKEYEIVDGKRIPVYETKPTTTPSAKVVEAPNENKIKDKLMRGEQLTDTEKEFIENQKVQYTNLINLSSEEASKLNNKDFDRWSYTRANEEYMGSVGVNNANELHKALILRGELSNAETVRNRIIFSNEKDENGNVLNKNIEQNKETEQIINEMKKRESLATKEPKETRIVEEKEVPVYEQKATEPIIASKGGIIPKTQDKAKLFEKPAPSGTVTQYQTPDTDVIIEVLKIDNEKANLSKLVKNYIEPEKFGDWKQTERRTIKTKDIGKYIPAGSKIIKTYEIPATTLPDTQKGVKEAQLPAEEGITPAPQGTAKEPYQMTKADIIKEDLAKNFVKTSDNLYHFRFEDGTLSQPGQSLRKLDWSDIIETHEYQVKQALSEGKTVPAEVLKDYPDLQAQVKPIITKKISPAPKRTAKKPYQMTKEGITVSKLYGVSSVPYQWKGNRVKITGLEDKNFAVYNTKSGWHLSEIDKDNNVIRNYGGEQAGVGRIGFGTPQEAINNGYKEVLKDYPDLQKQVKPAGHPPVSVEEAKAGVKKVMKIDINEGFENQYSQVIDKIKDWDKRIIKQIENKLKNFRGFVKVVGKNFDFMPSEKLKVNLQSAYNLAKKRYKTADIYFIDNKTQLQEQELPITAVGKPKEEVAEEEVKRIDEFLTKQLTSSQYKKIIAEKTGVTVPQKIIKMREDIALRKQIQDEVRGARIGFKEGVSITKEQMITKFKEGQQRIEDIINYIKQKLPINEQGKFINAIKNAKTAARQYSIFGRIDRTKEELERKKIISEIKTLAKPKGNIIVEYQRLLKNTISDIDLINPTENTIEKLKRLKDYIARNGEPLGINPKRVEQLNRLTKKPIKAMTTDELTEVKDTMNQLRQLGMLKLQLQNRYHARQQTINMARLLNSTHNQDIKPTGNEKLDITRKEIKETYINTLHTIRVADMIDGYKGYKGENAKYIKRLASLENRAKINSEIDKTELLEKIRDIKPEWTEQEQRDVVLLLHNEQRQFEQVQGIISEYDYKKLPEKTEQYQKTMDLIRNYYKKDYAKIQAIHEERTNEILGKVENYFPIKYKREFNILPVEAVNPKRFRRIQTYQGFTFGRKPGVEKIPRTDLFGILEESINERNWYVGMQPELDNIAELVKSKEFYSRAGEMVYTFWANVLDVTSRRGWSASAQPNFLLKQGRINLNNAILGYKVTSIAMQPFAIFDALAYSSVALPLESLYEVSKEFTKAWIIPNYAKGIITNSNALRLRKGGEMAIEESLQENKNISKVYKFLKDNGLALLQWADIKTASGVTNGVHRILQKYNVPNAEEEADIIMNLVSGSNDVVLRPLILSKGEGARTWFTFQTFFLNRWGIMIHDLIISGLLKSKGISKRLWALIGLGIFVAGSIAEKETRKKIYYFITGKETKPESTLKTALLTIPSQVPYFGNLLEAGLGGYDADPPLIKTLENIFKGLGGIAGKKPETKMKGILRMSESLLILTLGIPGTAQIFDIIERVAKPVLVPLSTKELKEKISTAQNAIDKFMINLRIQKIIEKRQRKGKK